MSYILDALRKSDRERAGERAPAQPAGGAPGFRAGQPPSGRRGIAAAVAALTLIAGIGAGVWIGQQSPAAPPLAAPLGAPEAPAPLATAEAAAPLPAVAATGDGTTAAPEAPRRPEGILELWQLTEAEQRYLQALDVTLHVHSSDPGQRAVIINGLRAREGQDLGEALRLAEIVPDGLILEFQGQMVHLPNPQPY